MMIKHTCGLSDKVSKLCYTQLTTGRGGNMKPDGFGAKAVFTAGVILY